MPMKIVADRAIPFVREAFSDFGEIVLEHGRSITPALVNDATVLLVRSVTSVADALVRNSTLRLVASATIGTEHVDVAALKKRGIHFVWAPGSNANSVAQYIVAALLCVSRKYSFDLSQKVLGIVGVGNIGSIVHHYAQALGMRCVLCDPPLKRLHGNNIYSSYDTLLDESDIITIHVPLTKNGSDPTWHLVNESFLRRMKKGAILINTSRGHVVDQAALKAHRQSLGGLVLDVWQNEPAIDYELVSMADIATPHIAGYSFDGKINGVTMIHRSTTAFLGSTPAWSPQRLLDIPGHTIDLRNVSDPLFTAVTTAYPLLTDDAGLRDLSPLSLDERAKGFDLLREKYPRRLEFSHHTVRCRPSQHPFAERLRLLGFKTHLEE